MMKIVVTITDNSSRNEWDEFYMLPDGVDDDTVWDIMEKELTKFNTTLRSNESPRTIMEINEDDSINESYCGILIQHEWRKTNLVTLMDGRSSYDTVACEKCGITGKRYGLGISGVHRDKKYQSIKYGTCIL
jgi:hypothetical protein